MYFLLFKFLEKVGFSLWENLIKFIETRCQKIEEFDRTTN
jgi:hypothetical protein